MSIARRVLHRDGTAMRESRLVCGIDQVCVVVRDLDGALETMTTKAGIGPFKTWTLQSPWVSRTTYRGRRVRWSMRLGLAYVGGIQCEVIQPANGLRCTATTSAGTAMACITCSSPRAVPGAAPWPAWRHTVPRTRKAPSC
jgi:hypothetical protein